MRGLLLTLLIAIALASPVRAGQGETLVWAVLDFPPFQILSGAQAGTGSFDGELQALIAGMPELDHRVVPMSFARRKEEFMAGTNLCTPGIFQAPAKALGLAISMPALTHLDNRVVFLADQAARFGNESSLDLDALLQRPDLVGGVIDGRSYAPGIDASLARHRGRPNLVVRAVPAGRMFQMLLAGNLDYVLMFSHEAAFFAADLSDGTGSGKPVRNRAIKGAPPYLFTHVACTGNDWGRRMIARIDDVIRGLRDKPEYRKLSERWYPAEDQLRVRRFMPHMLAAPP